MLPNYLDYIAKQFLLSVLVALPVLLFSAREGWSLPLCEGSYKKNTWTDCLGNVSLPSGSKYYGEWKNGIQHGEGTATYANGGKYVGNWRNGRPNGRGTYIHANGDTYDGEFKDGKGHGQGTYTYANGDKYVGEIQRRREKWTRHLQLFQW